MPARPPLRGPGARGRAAPGTGRRRALLAALGLLGAAFAARAHTPYRQWRVLRERFLLVHSVRTDPASDVIAEKLVAILIATLPESSPLVARAPSLERVASLMTSDQARLAVLSRADARRLQLRQDELAAYDPRGLRLLLEIDAHVLLTTERLPRRHGWQLADALSRNAGDLAIRVPDSSATFPAHPGSRAFARGEPLEAQQ